MSQEKLNYLNKNLDSNTNELPNKYIEIFENYLFFYFLKII